MTLARIDNAIPNPSAEVNTTGWAALASSSLSRTTNASLAWAGVAAFTVSATAAVATIGMTTPTLVADANRVLVTAGQPASARARVMTSTASRRARLVIEWRTSASALVSTSTGAWFNLTSTVPVTISLEGLTVPATAVFASVRVEYGALAGSVAIGNVVTVDAIQLSPTEAVATYVDGSLGAYHYWTGTAHQSPSYRVALQLQQTQASGGLTRISSELWLANQDGQLLENISLTALEGKVSANVHNAIKTSLQLSVLVPNDVVPYSSIVAPIINVTDVNGISQRHQLGLFVTTPAKHDHYQSFSMGAIEGKDLTWLLATDSFGDVYSLELGDNYIAEAIAIIAGLGLRYSIPSSALTLPHAISWPPDATKLEIVNDLLNAAGYYTLWADRYGVCKSVPYFELASATPALQLYSGEGSVVIDAIEQEGVYETVANKIIVYHENLDGDPIVVTRINNDPSSPTSTVSLGRVITRMLTGTDIANVDVAKAIAKRAIEEAASYTNKLKVTTFPLPDRELHEVYDLAIYNADGLAIGLGRWWCDAWEIGLTLKSAKMVHQIKRLEPYGWSEVVL